MYAFWKPLKTKRVLILLILTTTGDSVEEAIKEDVEDMTNEDSAIEQDENEEDADESKDNEEEDENEDISDKSTVADPLFPRKIRIPRIPSVCGWC